MRLRVICRISALVAVCALAIGVTAAPAYAADSRQGDVELVVQREGRWTAVEADRLTASALDLDGPGTSDGPGTITPQLIDFSQWVSCFTLNNENDVFGYYWFPWDGKQNAVNLKCGNSKFGYKHIRERHEAQWQTVLDAARARGWNSAAFRVESWDDLMSGVTSAVVADPGPGLTNISAANKWCTKAQFGLRVVNSTAILYSFGVETVWASDSDRLLTSFPSERAVCNP